MAEVISTGTRVTIQAIEGLFYGTVIGNRDAYMSELNPPKLPNALETNLKEKILETTSVVPLHEPDPFKIITLYEVELDDPTNYRGSKRNGNIATNVYKFITPIEQNETTVQP